MPQILTNYAAIRRGRDVVAPFCRAGYASRSLIYFVIGFFAVLSALGRGSDKDSKGALRTIMSGGVGDVLAWALILGLLSYALWRLAQALFDTDDHGTDAKGLLVRAGLFGAAGSYGALCLYAFALWHGEGAGSSGHGHLAETLAGFVGSRVVAWGLALVFVGVGVAHFVKALKKTYARYIEASPRVMRFIHPIARAGLTARGIVFVVIGVLFAYRGIHGTGGKPGIAAALDFIRDLPAGSALLALAGLGLIAFAVYSLAEAIWRRITL